MSFRVKGTICLNCNGILQNNLDPDMWFHVNANAFNTCKIVGGKPSSIIEMEINPSNGETVSNFILRGNNR